jgi:hypothetical protein
VSLRREAAANTSTPSEGSTKGMTLRAETNPASFGIHSSVTGSPSSRVPIRCAEGRKLAVHHLQALPGAVHTRGGGEVVQNPAQARSVGKHPQLRPQRATRDPQSSGMPVISFYPRAKGVFARGMVL